MAAQLWQAFVGGTYQALSPSIAADQAVNVFQEQRRVPGSPKQVTFYGTPGRVLETTLATLSNRGWFTQDGQTWTVNGNTLYERTAPATYVSRGTIMDDGLPVSFASNGLGGDQLGIVGGGELKVLDLVTDVLSAAIVLPFPDPVMIAFIDGYALINQENTPIVWFSALEDMETWDAIDFFTRSNTSDNVVGIGVSRDRVWVFGSKTSTLYYDSGDTDTPFLPYPGTTFQVGLASPWLLNIYNDTFRWVAVSSRGQFRVVEATEPSPQEISTPPIVLFLNSASTLTDARTLTYEQEGHVFVAFTVPSASGDLKTPVYDATEQLWHYRAGWDAVTGRYTRWPAQGCTTVDGTVLVGDYATGAIYELDLDTYDDASGVLMRERTAPYASDSAEFVFVDQFELGIQPGVGLSTGQGSAPQVELSLSRDGAHTWVSAGFATMGAMGDYVARAIWRRLGRARADRLVFRVRQSDPVKCVIGPGAWITITNGTGQL